MSEQEIYVRQMNAWMKEQEARREQVVAKMRKRK